MSIQILSAVRDCGPRELTRYSVLETLANYADDFGFCFPGMDKIAWESRCDERTVRRQIVELDREGWLFVTRKVLNGKANVYQLNLGKIGVTVSPKAKRNPVFIRLLKMYADAMSPVFATVATDPREVQEGSEKPVQKAVEPFFAPGESADTDEFSEDNPQPLTGQSRPTQRTNEGGSEDIACPPNRYNHQEPSIEPPILEPEPPTPFAKGVEDEPVSVLIAGDRWGSFLVRLKAELSGVGHYPGGHLRELVPGENDFDAAFRGWRLDGVSFRDPTWIFDTDALDPELTRRAIEKYRVRLERAARDVFSIPKRQSLRFRVGETTTRTQAA